MKSVLLITLVICACLGVQAQDFGLAAIEESKKRLESKLDIEQMEYEQVLFSHRQLKESLDKNKDVAVIKHALLGVSADIVSHAAISIEVIDLLEDYNNKLMRRLAQGKALPEGFEKLTNRILVAVDRRVPKECIQDMKAAKKMVEAAAARKKTPEGKTRPA